MQKVALFLVMLSAVSAVAQESSPRAATLAQQKMCDEQARKKFNEEEASRKGAEYTSHYDAHMNVCYIMVHFGGVNVGVPSVSYDVYDAFENRTYASYIWVNTTKKKYWEVAPDVCWVKPLGHAKIQCKTDDEFEELVDKYFGIGR